MKRRADAAEVAPKAHRSEGAMWRHRFDLFAAGVGIAFLALAICFALDALDEWSADLAWIAPVALIVIGAIGVLSTVARTRGGALTRSDEPGS